MVRWFVWLFNQCCCCWSRVCDCEGFGWLFEKFYIIAILHVMVVLATRKRYGVVFVVKYMYG